MTPEHGIDRYDDCRQCGGQYRYFSKAAFEICDECGHKRRYTDTSPWWERAACKGIDIKVFYPQRGNPAKKAKRICATCPVLNTCRAYALMAGERVGIWGGLSEKERRLIRAARGIIDIRCADCAGWFTPTNSRRVYCDECRTTEARLERRARYSREKRLRRAS